MNQTEERIIQRFHVRRDDDLSELKYKLFSDDGWKRRREFYGFTRSKDGEYATHSKS